MRLLQWLEPLGTEIGQGRQVVLLREIFAQQYVVKQGGEIEPVKVHATGVVQNPHDPDAQWSAKGQGKQRKDWVGYKVQVAETVASQGDQSSFISSVVTQRATESDDAGLPATVARQQSEEFQLQMHQRNAIEGTISALRSRPRSTGVPATKVLRRWICKTTCSRRLQYQTMVAKAPGNRSCSRADGVGLRGVFSGAFDQHFIHPDPWGISGKKMCPKATAVRAKLYISPRAFRASLINSMDKFVRAHQA